MDSGFQKKELAHMLGVTEKTVINWELRGRRPMRKEVIEKVNVFIFEIRDLVREKFK